MKELETIDAETLLYNPLEQVEYIIQDILPTGLHLFCGASKIGKSWLMLKMCLQVSKGEELWGLKTKESEVLYLCLEDTFSRIQSRLFKLTDEANEKLNFAISTNKISNGLVMQLEEYLKQKSNTRFIVIDTLQKIIKIWKKQTNPRRTIGHKQMLIQKENRGTDYALNLLKRYLTETSNYGKKDCFFLKIDLSGYFMSIDRKQISKKFFNLILKKYGKRSIKCSKNLTLML